MAVNEDIIDRDSAQAMLPVLFELHVPAMPLSEFVEVFWYWEGYEAPYAQERIMPMGTVELVINLASGRTAESGIAGPRSQSHPAGNQWWIATHKEDMSSEELARRASERKG